MPKRGFTLIELLVVIAIIAILAAILFPVFARVREKAKQTSCLSNIKELALGMLMYMGDYDSRMPDTGCAAYQYGTIWDIAIQAYVKNFQIYQCPSDQTPMFVSSTNNICGGSWSACPAWVQEHYLSYGMGLQIARVMEEDIRLPAETMMLCEARYPWVEVGPRPPFNYVDWAAKKERHNAGSNIALCDGHAKWYSKDTIQAGEGLHNRPDGTD